MSTIFRVERTGNFLYDFFLLFGSKLRDLVRGWDWHFSRFYHLFHRRLAAVKLLIDEGRRKSTTVPCYIKSAKSEDETQTALWRGFLYLLNLFVRYIGLALYDFFLLFGSKLRDLVRGCPFRNGNNRTCKIRQSDTPCRSWRGLRHHQRYHGQACNSVMQAENWIHKPITVKK